MTQKTIFSIIISSVLLYSCQKDFSLDAPAQTNASTSNDSIYIDKIYYLKVNGSNIDTSGIWSYEYDNLKRVKSMLVASTDLTDSSGKKFFYSYYASDTLPFKTEYYEKSFSPPPPGFPGSTYRTDTTITYHFFDNIGRNSKDSIITLFGQGPRYAVTNFSYTANKIIGYYSNIVPTGITPTEQKDTAITDANGNVIESKRYSKDFNTNIWQLVSVSNFTYDNKISPFSRLSNFKTFGIFASGETLFGQLPQINNRITQNEQITILNPPFPPFQTLYAFNATNTYRLNGLLKEVNFSFISPVIPNPGKAVFTYKNL
jgi:hypothetical protein